MRKAKTERTGLPGTNDSRSSRNHPEDPKRLGQQASAAGQQYEKAVAVKPSVREGPRGDRKVVIAL